MEYRPLGQTGEEVSILSFGASSLGGVFRDIDEDRAIEAVHTGLDGGMNLIDVSPFYGLTKAENVLGRALADVDRDRYLLSTKCGRYGDNPEDFDFSADRITRSIDESLQRMGLEYVDILLAHDIEYGDMNQIVDETIPALEKIKASGKTRFIGVSGLPLKTLGEAVERSGSTLDIVLSYCHYELNDTTLLGWLDQFEAAGIGVINASPLGMGLLSPREVVDWHPAPADIQETCQRAAEYCQEQGESIIKLAIQFAVRQPRVATTLVGSANPDNIAKNIQWVDEPVNEELLEEVLKILEPIQGRTWPSGNVTDVD
ncbi:MAG: aldo/keto reductase [Phycisphaeraceae bacterium]|nr:aldo/keto reductase [Phycisphaeraceae bacterium]